ncbi:hypothetical protein TCE0_034f10013 [Talaromyces pinophilus]|uniref:Uncharacterized protein n=1 Tax=Talaromyces pinophilus TaxID=128442 RepID=A0A6V8HBS2_TALPI|nr:hypothetical protein TCE0_034f10013 [Talaromyces pinophilus]
MSSVKPTTVHTQGGAGFGGDLKAKRDINISNLGTRGLEAGSTPEHSSKTIIVDDILNMINYNMIRSSPAHVLRSLELIIDEFRNGKRANSAISSESLSTNEEEAWKQLRDELRSMGISQDALSRHQHLIMATLTEAINNEKRENNIYFDQDRERDLDEKEEMKGRPQSANGDSIDQMSQDGNPKSVPQVRVKQAKRAFWVPRFVYKAMKTNEKNSSQRLLGKQSLEGELDENELFQAAAKGDVDKIYLLVKNGADLNMKNREQDTLLVFGARYGHEFLVRVLLQVEVGYKYAQVTKMIAAKHLV